MEKLLKKMKSVYKWTSKSGDYSNYFNSLQEKLTDLMYVSKHVGINLFN